MLPTSNKFMGLLQNRLQILAGAFLVVLDVPATRADQENREKLAD